MRKTSYFFDHNICLYYTNKRILFLLRDAVIFSSESDDEMSKTEFWEKTPKIQASTKNAISAFHASLMGQLRNGRASW